MAMLRLFRLLLLLLLLAAAGLFGAMNSQAVGLNLGWTRLQLPLGVLLLLFAALGAACAGLLLWSTRVRQLKRELARSAAANAATDRRTR